MTIHEQRAKEQFLSGYNCAQAVLAAFAPELGMDEKTAAKLAAGFGGGMAGMREVCGAISGMMMAASALYGYDEPGAYEEKVAHYALVRGLIEQFQADKGSIICRELLGLGKDAPAQTPAKRTPEYYKSRPCAELIGHAAALLDAYIEAHPIEKK